MHLGRAVRLRERREPGQVCEEDSDLLVAAQRLVEVERAEALLVPLAPRRPADRDEADHHQPVPLPPRELPAGREREHRDDERLGEQRERERDGEREPAAAPRVDAEVRDRRVGVGDDARRAEGGERRGHVGRLDRLAQRLELRERDDGPRDDHREHDPEQPAAAPDDPERGLEPVLDRRRGGEQARRGRGRSASRARSRRCGTGSPRPASRARAARGSRRSYEREADQQQPRVAAAHRALGDRDREGEADRRRDQHDPEVRGVVLPALVDVRRAAQDPDQRERQQQEQRPVRVAQRDLGAGGCGRRCDAERVTPPPRSRKR